MNNSQPSKSESASKEIIIETDEGTILGHSTEVDAFPQKIIPASSEELQKFKDWETQSKIFLSEYGDKRSFSDLIQYDIAFKSWLRSNKKAFSEQEVINLLGAHLGQRLVEDFNMEWVVVTDQYGQDYAVRNWELRYMSFPFSSVQKRIENPNP